MKKELSLSQLAYLTFYVILLLALGKTFASCDIRTGTYTLGWGCSDAVSCARSVASAIGAYVISIQMNGENSFTATFLVKQAEGAADCGCLEAQKTLGTFTQEGNLINAGSHNMPQNPSCGDAAFDSTVNPIIGTSCYELGDINPDKPPVINGVTITSGKWVYVTLHRTTNSGGPMSDTSFKTVTSHGCSDISENGINLTKGNARDTTFNQDGVTLHGCNYNGKMLSGSCSQNNLDTSCGGAVPVNYNSANDSILNNCKFGNPSIDSTQKSKRDTVSLHGDSALSTTQFGIGANGIIEAQGKTTDAIGTSNGLLGDIKNAINSGFNAVTGLLGSILNKPVNVGDTSAFDTTGLHSGDTIFDSTGTVPSFGDSGAQWSSFRAKMDSIRRIDSSDTNITVDSNGISHIFDSLKVNWGDTSDCGCDSTAITIPFWNKNYPVNLCFGDPAQYTKPIFKLLAGIFIFLFYRFSVFQVIIKVFANII